MLPIREDCNRVLEILQPPREGCLVIRIITLNMCRFVVAAQARRRQRQSLFRLLFLRILCWLLFLGLRPCG